MLTDKHGVFNMLLGNLDLNAGAEQVELMSI